MTKPLSALAALLIAGALTGCVQTQWTPVGRQPLPDSVAANGVEHRAEQRGDNADENRYVPSDSELSAFHNAKWKDGRTEDQWNSLYQDVTGRPGLKNPSTDDLIQWVALKWGIPTAWIRAQMVQESRWHQSQLGDRATVPASWYSKYPPRARIPGTSDVYQSMGISQVKWKPDGSQWPGTEPLRWKSTAFALDFYAATLRYYYDGRCDWCGSGYSSGQKWNSVGAWFNPLPWGSSTSYVNSVKHYLQTARTGP